MPFRFSSCLVIDRRDKRGMFQPTINFSFLGSSDPTFVGRMLNRINGFHLCFSLVFRSRWHALVTAIVRNPFRFRHRARSVVESSSNSSSYERRRPHPATISRRSTVSVPPFSTTTAKSQTRSSTDQVRPLDRKLVLFPVSVPSTLC